MITQRLTFLVRGIWIPPPEPLVRSTSLDEPLLHSATAKTLTFHIQAADLRGFTQAQEGQPREMHIS